MFVASCGAIPQGRAPAAAPQSVPKAQAISRPAMQQCYAKLQENLVAFQSLPDMDDTGRCGWVNAVKLMDFGTPATNMGAMTCPLAAQFSAWAQFAVRPAARLYLGSEVARIETMGTYNCRRVAGTTVLSEHGRGNAIDISGFVLENGRRISLRSGWRGTSDERKFLRRLRESACKRFNVVLSPDFNKAHANHFHFDMGRAGKDGISRCR